MGEVKARNWIKDGTDDTAAYVIRVTRGNDLVGFLAGDLSTVLDLLGDQAYAEAVGEEADDITVWVIHEAGMLPCSITSKGHPKIGMVEHTVKWLDPYRSAREQRNNWPHETGYTKIADF